MLSALGQGGEALELSLAVCPHLLRQVRGLELVAQLVDHTSDLAHGVVPANVKKDGSMAKRAQVELFFAEVQCGGLR